MEIHNLIKQILFMKDTMLAMAAQIARIPIAYKACNSMGRILCIAMLRIIHPLQMLLLLYRSGQTL